jgi:hypothetical protein
MRWIKTVGFCLGVMFVIGILTPAPVQAQYFGGYGAGFTPSPTALYGPNGAVTGVLSPNGYVQGYGYAPPPPMNVYSGGMYGGMGYGGRMPLGQAIVTSAIIMNMNRGYGGGYSYGNRGYGWGNRHMMHEMREHGGYRR